jgi:small-conductance mechanosensitive channel
VEFLDKIYLGNTLKSWIIALAVAVFIFASLKIAQRMLVARLSRLAESTDNQLDDFIVSVLKQTRFFILLVASIYVASFAVSLKPSVAAIWHKAVILILIVQGGLWASAGVKFWLRLALKKRMEEDSSSATTLSLLGFIARLVLWIIVFLLILDNLGVNITGLVAGLGIGGIAVALAVQNILGDLLASLSIVLDKPFIIGDFIVVDSLAGTVEHIGLKTTRIRSISGEQLIFANNDLLKSRIRNYKRMQERRIVFGFGVTYATPPEKLRLVKKIVEEAISRQENARLDRVHFKEFGESSLNFEVVYFVAKPDFALYMDIQESINLDLSASFAREGIEFAYPTRTLIVQPPPGEKSSS